MMLATFIMNSSWSLLTLLSSDVELEHFERLGQACTLLIVKKNKTADLSFRDNDTKSSFCSNNHHKSSANCKMFR